MRLPASVDIRIANSAGHRRPLGVADNDEATGTLELLEEVRIDECPDGVSETKPYHDPSSFSYEGIAKGVTILISQGHSPKVAGNPRSSR